jgi:hypothetical protein
LIGAVWLAKAPAARGDFVLTGATEFGTDATGAYTTTPQGVISNTVGGDAPFNLYITQPNTGINGAFLNSGDGASTGLNLSLTPGTYQFFMFFYPGTDVGRFGLNLFFNGSNNPGISVFAPTSNTLTPPFPAFSVNTSPSTYSIVPDISGPTMVAGAGSATFSSGGTTATLTSYWLANPTASGMDRVSPYNNVPGASNNFVGEFTLSVVPEPSGVILLGAGLACLGGVHRFRRRTAA